MNDAPREVVRQLTAYAVVGVIGTVLDVALFWVLVRLGVWIPLAVTLAFFGATAAQFVLNRHWSFRASHRPAIVQVPIYAIVTFVNLLLTLALVEAGIGLLHLSPIAAKVFSIPPTALVGFVANRYLTFGIGVRATFERLANHVRMKDRGGVR
ncbi:MAG: GtrA family protein [Candidatus Tumulicola sp.]